MYLCRNGRPNAGMPYVMAAFILLSLFFACCALPGCGREEIQTSNLRVGVLSGDLRQLPYYIAREKGFFSNAGLEVKEEFMFGTGAELMSAFMAGQIDIGYVDIGSPVTFAARNMTDVKAIAQSARGGSALVVKSGLEAGDITELKEQRVGIPAVASLEDYLLATAIDQAGITENDMDIVEVRPYDMVSYLSAGSIEAFMGSEPYPSTAEVDESGHVIMTSDDIDKNISSSLLVAGGSFAGRNPDTLKKIESAHRQAVKFIRENPVESADLGNLETNIGKEEARRSVELIQYDSVIDGRSLQNYVSFLRDIGVIDVDPADFVKRFVMHVR